MYSRIKKKMCRGAGKRGQAMTREEAIEYLTILGGIGGITDNEAMALEIAIEALEQEPVIDKIRAEIREWYWQADKQELAKDPCVVDAMIDLFIRTIAKYQAESEDKE